MQYLCALYELYTQYRPEICKAGCATKTAPPKRSRFSLRRTQARLTHNEKSLNHCHQPDENRISAYVPAVDSPANTTYNLILLK